MTTILPRRNKAPMGKNNFSIDALIGNGKDDLASENSASYHAENSNINYNSCIIDYARSPSNKLSHCNERVVGLSGKTQEERQVSKRSQSAEFARKVTAKLARTSYSADAAAQLDQAKISKNPSSTQLYSKEDSLQQSHSDKYQTRSLINYPYYNILRENGLTYPYDVVALVKPQHYMYPTFDPNSLTEHPAFMYPYLGYANMKDDLKSLNHLYLSSVWNERVPTLQHRPYYPPTPNLTPFSPSDLDLDVDNMQGSVRLTKQDHVDVSPDDNTSFRFSNNGPHSPRLRHKKKMEKDADTSNEVGAKRKANKIREKCNKVKSEKLDREDSISPDRMAYLRDKYFAAYGSRFNPFTSFLTPSDIIIPDYLYQTSFFRKGKRIRTAFSPSQLLKLEDAFEKNHYVVGTERKELAKNLALTETQVKVWFQNRRTKHKKEDGAELSAHENSNPEIKGEQHSDI